MSDIDFRKKFVLFFFAVVVLVGGIFALTNQISDDVDNSGSNTSISEFNPQLVNSRTEDTNEITGFNPSSDTQVLQQEDTTETIDFLLYETFHEDGATIEYAVPIITNKEILGELNGYTDSFGWDDRVSIDNLQYFYDNSLVIYFEDRDPYQESLDTSDDIERATLFNGIQEVDIQEEYSFDAYDLISGAGGARLGVGIKKFNDVAIEISYPWGWREGYYFIQDRYDLFEAPEEEITSAYKAFIVGQESENFYSDLSEEGIEEYVYEFVVDKHKEKWIHTLESAEMVSIGSRAEITEVSWDEAIRMHDEYDRILNGLYQNLIRLYSEQDMEYQVDILHDQQRDWIRMRDEACADIQEASKTMCLADQTYGRMMTLSKGVFESSR